MVTPYFLSIRETIITAISKASTSVDIAVAWFTNEQIFDEVLERLDSGVRVRLVMINDDINHCGGLDFQKFIDKGGELYFGKNGFFMHNKYCIIDGNTVLTGSYNYTYFAEHTNFENIVCIADEEKAVAAFIDNYEGILSVSDKAGDIEGFLKNHPYSINSHASRGILNRDAYQKAGELFGKDENERANHIIDSLKAASGNRRLDTFVIRDVQYIQWQKGYCIERIEVTPTDVFFDINVQAVCNSFYVYGPELDKTWHIIREDGTYIYASAVTDIKIDGTPLADKAASRTTYKYEIEGYHSNVEHAFRAHPLIPNVDTFIERGLKPEGTNSLTCRLSFPRGSYIDGNVDLCEGNDRDKGADNYWHFFKVNMALNRESE